MHLTYPVAEIGTALLLAAGFGGYSIGAAVIAARCQDRRERYRRRKTLSFILALIVAAGVTILWARLLRGAGTFFGLLGGGLAVALREPLLAIAGRIALLTGRAYEVGDRVQIESVVGDVVDIGFVYTRLMEIGNWVGGDQATGRIVQFSNSKLFGATPVYNYTRDFDFIWDEIMLPITYASDVRRAREILIEAGQAYSREFLKGAQRQLEAMRRRYLVPGLDLEPQTYMGVTSNWVELRLRYVVDPKKRRIAASFIWEQVFGRIQAEKRIEISSETENVTVSMAQPPE